MPCGACREFFYQLNEENEDMEIMLDYGKRETVALKELLPNWWGKERCREAKAMRQIPASQDDDEERNRHETEKLPDSR